ncbi:MAG: thiamine-binding protein [Flaviaesturariibacter sp.]|nr:thiamine-binding protein [Flaviaesturariibacter sp.]
MHSFLVNASLQILPVTKDRHPYEWVDEAIDVIRKSGIRYEVGPFATVLEGTYAHVMQVLADVNEHLASRGCPEWIAGFQIQIRSDRDITAGEKTAKYQ